MGIFVALDVMIGLIFMYLLLAIMCTMINEWIATLVRLRARTLRTAVGRLVDAPDGQPGKRLSVEVFDHPLIRSLKDWRRGPSYVPPPRFVAALKDTMETRGTAAGAEASAGKDVAHVESQLRALRRTVPPRVRRAAELTEAYEPGETRAADEDDRIEQWFNDAMERATGWYRRKLMLITVIVAAVLTIVANADTIAAVHILWHSPTVRAAIIAQARERVKKPRPADGGLFVQADYPDKDMPILDQSSGEPEEGEGENPEEMAAEAEEPPAPDSGLTDDEQAALGQIIGWGRDFKLINTDVCRERQTRINEVCRSEATTSPECTRVVDAGTAGGLCVQGSGGLEPTDAFPRWAAMWPLFANHFLGWFVTAVAVSMGAPFWFDTLKTFMGVRGAGKKPDEEKSK